MIPAGQGAPRRSALQSGDVNTVVAKASAGHVGGESWRLIPRLGLDAQASTMTDKLTRIALVNPDR